CSRVQFDQITPGVVCAEREVRISSHYLPYYRQDFGGSHGDQSVAIEINQSRGWDNFTSAAHSVVVDCISEYVVCLAGIAADHVAGLISDIGTLGAERDRDWPPVVGEQGSLWGWSRSCELPHSCAG